MSSSSSVAKRYEELGLAEALARPYDYPAACDELAAILRCAYSKLPKALQSLVFRDTLAAFRRLAEVPTSYGMSSATVLLQVAGATLPKQKRNLVSSEFKHAVVAHKRHYKAHQDGGSMQLPQDILSHVFSFLDMRSLVTVSLVCWAWNSAASDDMLWQLQYSLLFGKCGICCESKELVCRLVQDKNDIVIHQSIENVDPVAGVSWREGFKRKYMGKLWGVKHPRHAHLSALIVIPTYMEALAAKIYLQELHIHLPVNTGDPSWRFTSKRVSCGQCESIIWLSNMTSDRGHHCPNYESQKFKIKPISSYKVVDYLLGETTMAISSSDSDSDSEESSSLTLRMPKLWAYPKLTSTSESSS